MIPNLVHDDTGLVARHYRLFDGELSWDVLGTQERVLAAFVEGGNDLVHLSDELCGQVLARPVDTVRQWVAWIARLPVVEALHHHFRCC